MTHIHWVTRGTRTPKDRDEVNRREQSEDSHTQISTGRRMSCDGSGPGHGRVAQAELLKMQKSLLIMNR